MQMANVDISIIIPTKNNKGKLSEIINRFISENENINLEFIVIDMRSTDGSVMEALNLIKTKGLNGCVIQSGGGTVASALNTGIYRSSGKYVTFVYPTRLYKNYLGSYFDSIESKNADFVFAAPKSDSQQKALIPDGITGADIAVGLIRSSIVMDFTAVMFRREFLTDNGVRFYEECTLGYAEAFIFNALMFSPVITTTQSDIERDYNGSSIKDESKNTTNNCFERLDAMIRVYETVRLRHKDDKVLISAFRYRKLPAVAMSCVDKLLTEGFSSGAIRKQLSSKGYDEYIDYTADTPNDLKMKIITWKLLPFLYKP